MSLCVYVTVCLCHCVFMSSTDFIILLNGQTWTSSADTDAIVVHRDLDLNFVNVTFQLGWRLDVGLQERMFAFVITVPDSAQGNTRGLLGTYTNDVSDDLTLPDGSHLSMPQTTENIHYNFGQQCTSNVIFIVFEHCFKSPYSLHQQNRDLPFFETHDCLQGR